ncbi:type VI secretion system-associated protein TagF [Vibrio albus]|uniref:type VI secretion system-associated protein TagF n=1 Tax=Vibrio albus TaxID=2200953 RepID=UPI0015E84A30|nr:type VI secretion system-associated protein TagF [Vibrio albus]
MSEVITNRAAIGFFGKQPAHGDFLNRRLPNAFTSVWDHWLELAINESRQQLDEAWLNAYLTSPLWRFALSSGLCGEACWTGVLMPSVDNVGRYFPLTLAAALPERTDLADLMFNNEAWFNQCEEMALSALQNNFSLDAFDKELRNASTPHVKLSSQTTMQSTPLQVHVELPSLDPFNSGIQSLKDYLSSQLPEQCCLWWTHGSESIAPSLLITEGLPVKERYASLLDGDWEGRSWQQYDLTEHKESNHNTRHQAQ